MVATAVQPHLPGASRTSTTASTANAAQPSTLETLGTQPTASEQQRVSDLRQQFQQQAQQDPAGFRTAMREAFGDKASLAQIDQLLDLALAGKLPMPSNIQFVEAGSLGSDALGAYDANNGGSLYLDRSLLSDPTKLQSVFNEEMGHHLDALLGGADAAGDEGAVFSRTLELGKLSQSELTALKSEDDHGVIQVEGRWVQVEFNQDGADEADSDSEDTSSSDDSGGGECSVDSGGGNTSSGASESQSDSDTDSGGTDSSDTGGECGIGGDNDNEDTQDPYESDNKDDNNDHQNGNSDKDRAGDTQGTNAGGDPVGDEEATQAETTSGTPPDEDTEPAPEPEPEKRGFWSRTMDAVQTGLDVAGFIPGLGAVPDLVNAGIHLARGNKTEAAISAAAAIPLGGDAFKAGVMGVKAVDKAGDIRKAGQVLNQAGGASGRAGRQARLKELADDPKLGNADRGWLNQEKNAIERGNRTSIRNPPGKDLAHERGREAAKGYDYSYSNLQDRSLHRTQHKYDNFGRKNAERKPD